MNKIIAFLLVCSVGFSRDFGFIKFNAADIWVIEINDTLITSEQVLKIENGSYTFSARPQISYAWPAIYIKGDINVSPGDTTYYQLNTANSVADTVNLNKNLPLTTSYKGLDYHPQSNQYPKLKTGLLISSIASSWLAFYLKRRADNSYSKYNRASSRSDIDKYYQLAGDYDKASAVMISLSAAALTTYIYIALSE